MVELLVSGMVVNENVDWWSASVVSVKASLVTDVPIDEDDSVTSSMLVSVGSVTCSPVDDGQPVVKDNVL